MPFLDLGTRNKPTLWEYTSSESFLNTQLPKTRYQIPTHLGIGKGLANKHCHHTDTIEAFKKLFVEEFEAGLYNQEFFSALKKLYDDKLKALEKISADNFSQDSHTILAQKFEVAMVGEYEGHKPMVMALFTQYLQEFYEQKVREVLKAEENNPEYISSIISTLLTTTKTSFAQLEDDAIYNLAQKFLLKNSVNQESFKLFVSANNQAFQKLVDTFGWFHMEYAQDPLTFEDYVKIVWERIEKSHGNLGASPSEVRTSIKKAQKEFFDNHPEARYLKNLTEVIQEFAYILDDSKVVTVRAIFLSRPLMIEIAKRLELPLKDILFLTHPEIVELLKHNKKADPKLVEKRKDCRVILLKDGKISIWEGEEAKKKAQELLPEETNDSENSVKGIIAYPGIVKGKVTVIHSLQDRAKFKKGDIMVTHDGTAELTLFLREASAIVTDAGGMICHAAIIAREMKTPCIVGTKHASKIFKDGDMVEVDANKGIVRKI